METCDPDKLKENAVSPPLSASWPSAMVCIFPMASRLFVHTCAVHWLRPTGYEFNLR
jgi:hypothetical protein